MPKNQPTAGKRAREAARAGEKYTSALRAERGQEPPRLVPIVTTPCTAGCDGSGHPGRMCQTWKPFDDWGQARGDFDICQAASLPHRRAAHLTRRFQEKSSRHALDYTWVLTVVHAMLLHEEPELAPDPHRLRAAVEAGDLAAVDAVMQPLDFAAVRLLGTPAEDWHGTVRPRLSAWATKVTTAPPDDEPLRDMTLIEYESHCHGLAERWLRSQTKRRNSDGYTENSEPILWLFSVHFLDRLLIQQVGGHQRGSTVRLRDGRRVSIRGTHWGRTGHPPVAYDVREVGAPPFPLHNPRVDAGEIQDDR